MSSKIDLDQERANGIAWSFLQAYYPYLNANPSDLHRLYSADGILNHGDFQNPKNPTVTAFGTEQIRNQLTKSNLKGCKVMVSHADIQPCLSDKVLIMVLGELAIEDSPAYKFVQTFLVVPGSKPQTYDIANDVLKFIPEDDDDVLQPDVKKEEQEIKEEEVVEIADEKPAEIEEADEKDTSSVFSQDLNEKASTPETTNASTAELKEAAATEIAKVEPEKLATEAPVKPVEPIKPKSTDVQPAKQAKEQKEDKYSTDIKETKKETVVADEKTEKEKSVKSAAPAKALSWAAKAAQSSKKAVPPAPQPKKVVPPTKDETDASAVDKKDARIENQSTSSNKKGKKVPWFAVYVKGFSYFVPEEKIQSEFEANFGKVISVSLNNYVALIDFAEESSQAAAIKQHTLQIGSNLVEINPKIKRKDNGAVNGNAVSGNAGNANIKKRGSNKSKKAVAFKSD